ncbi:MAG TPA: ABC transporter permease [Mycobacteriales bacterium]|nr:ABC transporter permease [Mycobacteriales bacterium]
MSGLAQPARVSRFAVRDGVSDTVVMTWRNLLVWARVPAYIMFTLIQPVMFILLFRYVFGGAITTSAPGGYVDYLLPGVIGQTMGFGSFGTAIALANELQKGTIDRLRAMPIARSAVLLGRLAADTIRLFVVTLVLIAVGAAIGFRFHGGVGGAIAMVVYSVLLGLSVATISAYIGLTLKDEETVQGFGFVWVFPLTFVSSAFVPVQSMPGWLQAFAVNQPFTQVIDALRAFALGTPMGNHAWLSLVWMAGILAVFVPLAVRAYRKV